MVSTVLSGGIAYFNERLYYVPNYMVMKFKGNKQNIINTILKKIIFSSFILYYYVSWCIMVVISFKLFLSVIWIQRVTILLFLSFF